MIHLCSGLTWCEAEMEIEMDGNVAAVKNATIDPKRATCQKCLDAYETEMKKLGLG